MSTVTVKELDDLIAEIVKQEDIIEQKEEELSNENKKLMELNAKAVSYLKELDREDYKSAVGTAAIKQEWTVRNPETDADKELLFEHLRERGIFNKYATVNNRSLNSLFKSDWEEAKKRGEGLEFSLPGIKPAQLFEKFKLTRPRKKKSSGEASDVG